MSQQLAQLETRNAVSKTTYERQKDYGSKKLDHNSVLQTKQLLKRKHCKSIKKVSYQNLLLGAFCRDYRCHF
jgi:hypothetical protein